MGSRRCQSRGRQDGGQRQEEEAHVSMLWTTIFGDDVVKDRDAIVWCLGKDVRIDAESCADCFKADLRNLVDDDIWKGGEKRQWG